MHAACVPAIQPYVHVLLIVYICVNVCMHVCLRVSLLWMDGRMDVIIWYSFVYARMYVCVLRL